MKDEEIVVISLVEATENIIKHITPTKDSQHSLTLSVGMSLFLGALCHMEVDRKNQVMQPLEEHFKNFENERKTSDAVH